MPTADDIAWATGLFEGEGCMTVSARSPRLQLNMTDEDTVRRFQEIVETGAVYALAPERAGRKPKFHWQIATKVEVERLLLLFYSRLSARRKQRADEILAICRTGGRRTSDHRLVSYDGTPIKYKQQKEAAHV